MVLICPYFNKLQGDEKLICECARFKFPDMIARRDILYRFCAHPTGYNDCLLKQIMDRYYYERKYKTDASSFGG